MTSDFLTPIASQISSTLDSGWSRKKEMISAFCASRRFMQEGQYPPPFSRNTFPHSGQFLRFGSRAILSTPFPSCRLFYDRGQVSCSVLIRFYAREQENGANADNAPLSKNAICNSVREPKGKRPLENLVRIVTAPCASTPSLGGIIPFISSCLLYRNFSEKLNTFFNKFLKFFHGWGSKREMKGIDRFPFFFFFQSGI